MVPHMRRQQPPHGLPPDAHACEPLIRKPTAPAFPASTCCAASTAVPMLMASATGPRPHPLSHPTHVQARVQGLRVQNASMPLLALAHFADGSWLDISTRPGLSISSASHLLLQAERNASSWQASPAPGILRCAGGCASCAGRWGLHGAQLGHSGLLSRAVDGNRRVDV